MPVPQNKFREIVFLLIYSEENGESEEQGLVNLVMNELKVTKKAVLQALERSRLMKEKFAEIDQSIAAVSSSYDFDRIRVVEKNILRLALFEMNHDDTIPEKVAISEGIRLARKFSTPEAARFVNAILDAIYKKNSGEEGDSTLIAESAADLEASEAREQQAGADADE